MRYEEKKAISCNSGWAEKKKKIHVPVNGQSTYPRLAAVS